MKLYEALKLRNSDTIDTCDTVYDCIVTVDKQEEKTKDSYSNFCIELQKKVDFEKFFDGAYANAIVDWTGFLKKNYEKFAKYVKENWVVQKQYVLEDEDDFYCEWIEQLHLLLAGCGTSSMYEDLIVFLKTCK